jgi:hypothetical protein
LVVSRHDTLSLFSANRLQSTFFFPPPLGSSHSAVALFAVIFHLAHDLRTLDTGLPHTASGTARNAGLVLQSTQTSLLFHQLAAPRGPCLTIDLCRSRPRLVSLNGTAIAATIVEGSSDQFTPPITAVISLLGHVWPSRTQHEVFEQAFVGQVDA